MENIGSFTQDGSRKAGELVVPRTLHAGAADVVDGDSADTPVVEGLRYRVCLE